MSNNNTDFKIGLFLGILLGMIIGAGIMLSTISTEGVTLVDNEFLDNVCNQTFGVEYIYEDDTISGKDLEITCVPSVRLNKEYGWIGKK